MPRVLRSEAHADALREWTLAEACYSWSRYVASDATSAAGPDDECPCAGAARNEEYLVSCDPVRLTPLPPHHLPRVPLPTPRERHRDVRAVTFRAPSSLYSFPVERRRGGATTRRARDRPRPFVPVPSPPSLPTRPSPREHAPLPPNVSSSRRRLDTTSPRRRLPRPRRLRPATRVLSFRRRLRVHHRRVRRVPRRRASMVATRGGRPRGGTRRARRRVQPVEHARDSRRRRRGERQVGETRRGASLEGSCTVCTC